ncbi:MAG TPA: hypothetical protein DEP84_06785, partial [Chloroflexi bacterium]|nr:hypothetical protein [Chloroflexota bacterium]
TRRPAEAATPAQSSVGPTNPSTSWTGQLYPIGADVVTTVTPSGCPPAAQDPLNLVCDHFMLTVNVDPSYWDSHFGGVDIVIRWTSAGNDFDLYVYDASGNIVGKSTSGDTTFERVFVLEASGTYEVRVVPWLVIASDYSGSATFVSQEGGPTPNPPRQTGGLIFGPATVVDAQRTEGEPINHIDKDGNYWESGPWGTSTQQSFIHRSTDGGDQFNIVSPIGLRADVPPGGGDTDVVTDDQGHAYFVDLEGLVNLSTAVSNDGGNTWRKNALSVQSTVDDRQWFAMDNGPTAAAGDNTVFLAFRQVPLGSFIYSSPGSTGATDPVGGLVYQNSSANLADPVSDGAPCGQLRFDPVHRNLYYPCAQGDHVEITVGHVAPGQRTGIVYTNVQAPASPGGGPVGDLFPSVATDQAGNLYAVWIDETNHNVYYAASTDQGQTWNPAVQVNGNDANSNVFPWVQGGDDGRLVVAWYGSPSYLDSDFMPSWYNDRPPATEHKWFGYVALITNATGSAPSFAQQRFTEKPMHYGQICNEGLFCTTTDGDRTMADFFTVTLDRDGSLRIVYNDTTSQHHGAHLFEARQLAGPTASGSTISQPVPTNPMPDSTGDAQWPHYAPVSGPGPNLPQFDFTRLTLSQPEATTLRVEMTLNSLASLLPPAGKTSGFWITRFQALSVGDGGEEAYRIFYVGAVSVAGGQPAFFAGSGTSAQDAVPGTGCTTTTSENCKIVQYPPEVPATGRLDGNTITIDVPLEGGLGANRPIFGDTLFNVTAFSGGRDNASTDIYADVDATRAFDFQLSSVTLPPPKEPGRHVNGGGAISGRETSDAPFVLSAFENLSGKVSYRDAGAGVDFRSTRITSVTFNDAEQRSQIRGTGVNNDHQVDFTIEAVDNGEPGTVDHFSISLSDGYNNNGPPTRGNVQID